MGAWGEGLYDNDSALDTVGDLVDELDPTLDAAHLAGTVALSLQLLPSALETDGERWRERILGSPHLAGLPASARAMLESIANDPESAAKGRSRPAAHRALLGDYSDGPRYEVLFEVPGVADVVADFVEAISTRLDQLEEGDLYELSAEVAALGLLLDLGAIVDPSRLQAWKRAFAAADEITDDDRDFWDDYVSRVHGVFELLERRSV